MRIRGIAHSFPPNPPKTWRAPSRTSRSTTIGTPLESTGQAGGASKPATKRSGQEACRASPPHRHQDRRSRKHGGQVRREGSANLFEVLRYCPRLPAKPAKKHGG